ncbi:MAG: GTPase Era [Ignavibacteriales bacterium]|nr:GTPase Era [Ignavibacteriales bacterium]
MTKELSRDFRTGYVAIVGEPNVGKSTLMNALLQQKLSIVTRKPQTTRQRILGILNREDAQIIFLDTPGLLRPKYLLHEKMIGHAESALADADLILVLTEASRGSELPHEVEELIGRKTSSTPLLLVINKMDSLHRPEILPVIESFAARGVFREVIPVSALKGENLDELLKTVVQYLPRHEPLYPQDVVSEHPERFFVCELIREKIFEEYREEIPYSTAVEIVEYKERSIGKTYIGADIIVERESQKGILIGSKGEALKKIGQLSRAEIEQFIDRPVFLELRVKVREKWRESEAMLKRLGYGGERHA